MRHRKLRRGALARNPLFQNVTSLGVGYLTINPFRGDGIFRQDRLDAREALYEGEYLRLVRFDRPLWVCIDGRSDRGMVAIK